MRVAVDMEYLAEAVTIDISAEQLNRAIKKELDKVGFTSCYYEPKLGTMVYEVAVMPAELAVYGVRWNEIKEDAE